jgi:Na+/proline symporter
MKDKNLGKDGITEKYDFRGKYIEGGQILGMVVGYVYSLYNMVPSFLSEQNLNGRDAGKVIWGFLFGTASYFLGSYIHKRSEKKKEKALKNLELRLESEK